MVPNGASYNNYPPFGTNGTKTPPGGSTESAKYALGMVPADTFPAEWANYLFYGATQGITRLNQDTGSIKKEINTVLACKNITPDATACDQLYCALLKIRDDAVALAYPVGTVYMNAKSATLPAAIQAIGTWCAIDGRFLRACSACIGCTGGNNSVTLAVINLPSHCHGITDHCHSGSVGSHCHSGPSHCHSVDFFTHHQCDGQSTGCSCWVWNGGNAYSNTSTSSSIQSTGGMSANSTGYVYTNSNGNTSGTAQGGNIGLQKVSCYGATRWVLCTNSGNTCSALCVNVSHTHTISAHYHTVGTHYHRVCGNTGSAGTGNTGSTTPSFTGGKMCTAVNSGSTGSGCSFSILPPYRDVAMWYRDA